MTPFRTLTAFLADESGAVTVDWVVLTAGIVGLGLVVITTFTDGIFSATGAFSEQLDTTMAAAVALH